MPRLRVAAEFLFTCNRTIWQGLIFLRWIHGKRFEDRSRDIPVHFVAENFRKSYPDLIARDVVYAKGDVYTGPRLKDAVIEYFSLLEQCGFVRGTRRTVKGAPVFERLRTDLVDIPPEYSGYRYRLRPQGLVDTRTGEIVPI